ncbi:hypothetical protein FWD07_02645 [Candidatus Saccharibacteria bacterium]|nr:hypothetical protein [Candidatus Saccharibacteria bacterium]
MFSRVKAKLFEIYLARPLSIIVVYVVIVIAVATFAFVVSINNQASQTQQQYALSQTRTDILTQQQALQEKWEDITGVILHVNREIQTEVIQPLSELSLDLEAPEWSTVRHLTSNEFKRLQHYSEQIITLSDSYDIAALLTAATTLHYITRAVGNTVESFILPDNAIAHTADHLRGNLLAIAGQRGKEYYADLDSIVRFVNAAREFNRLLSTQNGQQITTELGLAPLTIPREIHLPGLTIQFGI